MRNFFLSTIKRPSGNPAFQMLVKTDNAGTSNNNQFAIPTGDGTFNYDVDWGDGSTSTGVTGNTTHTYSVAGEYVVKITGTFPHIRFNNGGDKGKLLEIKSWGDISWSSFNGSFFGCSNMNLTASDKPNLLLVTNADRAFRDCSSFNADIGHWDVSNINNAFEFFSNSAFDNGGSDSIDEWDVSSFDVFNNMFQSTPFNRYIASWDVSSVRLMVSMFESTPFDQDLGNWDFSSVESMTYFLNNSQLSTTNYDSLLVQLEATSQNSGISFHGGISTYTAGSAAATARQALITDHSWTITDGGAV